MKLRRVKSIFPGLLYCLSFASAPAAQQSANINIQTYNYRKPAEIDKSANRIKLPGTGYLTVAVDSPVTMVKGSFEGKGAVYHLVTPKGVVWEKKAAYGKGAKMPFEVKTGDVKTVTFAASGFSGKPFFLHDVRLMLADGTTASLVAAFQEGHEKLSKKDDVFMQKNKPEPPTVTLTKDVAAEQVREDHLAQLGPKELQVAVADELVRCERVLSRQAKRLSTAVVDKHKKTISGFKSKLASEVDTKLYLAIREFKRSLFLADPDIDFEQIVCIDNPYVNGLECWHEVRHRNEDTAVPGGRLLVLNGLGPDAAVRKLAPESKPAAFWRPDVSYDGKRVLYCMKGVDKSSFNLYEIGVDGSGYRQITDSDYNDLDPIYAPDGGIVFSTSRCNQYLRCGGSTFRMFVLARGDANGQNIYFLSANNEIDLLPAFLPDGRILYCRWEYVDKEVMRVQGLGCISKK